MLGGLTNNLLRALARLDLADLYGASRIPIYVLNVAYPLVPDEVKDFCIGKRAVLVVEEGSPEYVEQQINMILRGADIPTRVLGKGCLPRSGDYNAEALLRGIAAFLTQTRPAGIDADAIAKRAEEFLAHKPACRGRRRRHPGAAAELLHRLSGAAGVRRDQAGAARDRPDPYLGRHRLPFVRDLCAVLARQLDPRLRHVARQRRGRRPEHGEPPDLDHGRRRFLA